jgi:hypothetical protein
MAEGSNATRDIAFFHVRNISSKLKEMSDSSLPPCARNNAGKGN